MAMPHSLPAPEHDPREIRRALRRDDAEAFEIEYRQAMAAAAETLDLSSVLDLLERWRRIAWVGQDPVAERRMLAAADRLAAGEDIPTEIWDDTARRLGL